MDSAVHALRGRGLNPTDLHIALAGISYPARPSELADYARQRNADEQLVARLAALPDMPIVGPNQVCMAVFGRHAQIQGNP